MKPVESWLEEYGKSHQDPVNIAIHKFCVPAIMFSVLGLLWLVKIPAAGPFLNGGTILILFLGVFYAFLSLRLCLGILLEAALMTGLIWYVESSPALSLGVLSLSVFIVAWALQFVGHHIEGKKPSFSQDLIFLAIGPLWTLSLFYKKQGIRF